MAKYQPPKQSGFGQAFDAVFLLVLVFLALLVPLEMELAGAAKGDWLPGQMTVETATDGTTVVSNDKGLIKRTAPDGTISFENLTWEALEQTPVMQAQWGKLGMDLETAAAAITLRYDYSFSWGGLIATLAAIAGYFIFLVWQSDREYRQVIAEKFGNGS
ncbi:hypothetical protein [Dongia rigui]|uniref:Biopolymer transporter ExbD n=1 Tax=Dongia rigui TaxID=940149 RepID=A0ABU5E4T7_9PROT|nr:hypothetical protein [Dongia rigui]MDY0873886.1 hypothetical protein [Dongia rigui]